jgi:hypothetical protein
MSDTDRERDAEVAWTVEYNEELEIVELKLVGKLSGAELQESAASRIALGQEHDVTRFVINAADLISPRSTTMSIYEIAANTYSRSNQRRDTRIAVIVPTSPDSEWIIQFYEDLCVNRGWRVRMCDDRVAALAWLHEHVD